MWNRNALSERLNLEWPILQAPMGDFTTPSLAASVSNAGGLGGLGMFGFSAEDAKRRIDGFRQQSGGSLNVNYLLWSAPKDVPADGGPVGARLQELYAEKGLGPVPTPVTGAGEITADHLDMLADAKPEAVSVHFGLPDRETVSVIKSAGCYLICSATTVAEARAGSRWRRCGHRPGRRGRRTQRHLQRRRHQPTGRPIRAVTTSGAGRLSPGYCRWRNR